MPQLYQIIKNPIDKWTKITKSRYLLATNYIFFNCSQRIKCLHAVAFFVWKFQNLFCKNWNFRFISSKNDPMFQRNKHKRPSIICIYNMIMWFHNSSFVFFVHLVASQITSRNTTNFLVRGEGMGFLGACPFFKLKKKCLKWNFKVRIR
jgi:hypothetical protein